MQRLAHWQLPLGSNCFPLSAQSALSRSVAFRSLALAPDSTSTVPVVVAALVGLVTGLGAFTFHYGEGLSYFSTDPRACKNCHVMNDHFASWSHGPHHAVAGCVDCHLPHDFIAKYLAKADNGYRHSRAFTFMDFHEPIRMIERSAEAVQVNCVRCHADFVDDIVRGSTTSEDAMRCVHCHRQIGHGGRP